MNKVLLIIAMLSFLLPVAAHADLFNESDDSYYTRQIKSCLYKKPRTSVYDLFAATRPVYLDECCADSVEAMQKVDARRIAADDDCPDGMAKQSLSCETSKYWCAASD